MTIGCTATSITSTNRRLAALERGDPDFWTVTLEEINELAQEHDNDAFCLNMLTSVFWDLEVRANPTLRLEAIKGLWRLVTDWAMEAERKLK